MNHCNVSDTAVGWIMVHSTFVCMCVIVLDHVTLCIITFINVSLMYR